jgi:hypothetical protein
MRATGAGALVVKQLLNGADGGSAPVRDPPQSPRRHVTIIGPFRSGLDPVLVAFMVAAVGER